MTSAESDKNIELRSDYLAIRTQRGKVNLMGHQVSENELVARRFFFFPRARVDNEYIR